MEDIYIFMIFDLQAAVSLAARMERKRKANIITSTTYSSSLNTVF